MATPQPPSRPTYIGSVLRILDLSLGETLWSRRSAFMGLLLGLPLVIAVVSRLISVLAPKLALSVNGEAVNGAEMFGLMMWMLYIRFIVPILGVFYGTALIADEVEDRTITYLFTRPIPRGAVLVGKYLAYLASTILLIFPTVIIVFLVMVPVGGGSLAAMFPALLADLGILAAGLATYGAVFAWVGARVKRPLVAGLVFVLGWEPGVLLFPGYLKRLTVAYYLQGLVPHAMPPDSGISALLQAFTELPAVVPSLLALVAITAVGLWLAAKTVESREYVLEQ